jgi:hypothetical protein
LTYVKAVVTGLILLNLHDGRQTERGFQFPCSRAS